MLFRFLLFLFFFKDDALSRTSSRVIVEVPGRASSSLSLSNEIFVRLVVALHSLLLLACCSSSNMSPSLRFAVGRLIGDPIQIDWRESHNPFIQVSVDGLLTNLLKKGRDFKYYTVSFGFSKTCFNTQIQMRLRQSDELNLSPSSINTLKNVTLLLDLI